MCHSGAVQHNRKNEATAYSRGRMIRQHGAMYGMYATVSFHEIFSSSLLRNEVQACDGNFAAQNTFAVISFSQKNNYYLVHRFIYKCISQFCTRATSFTSRSVFSRSVGLAIYIYIYCSSFFKVYLGRQLFTSSATKNAYCRQ